jgi:hypothetical protein
MTDNPLSRSRNVVNPEWAIHSSHIPLVMPHHPLHHNQGPLVICLLVAPLAHSTRRHNFLNRHLQRSQSRISSHTSLRSHRSTSLHHIASHLRLPVIIIQRNSLTLASIQLRERTTTLSTGGLQFRTLLLLHHQLTSTLLLIRTTIDLHINNIHLDLTRPSRNH